MNMQQEVSQIVTNATADLRSGQIMPEQWRDVTRIPLKDAVLIYENGVQTRHEVLKLYTCGDVVIVEVTK
jgi:hypothetical protein